MRIIKAHTKKPMNMRRYRQLLEQHISDTGLMDSYVYPPISPEEDAKAKHLASEICKNIDTVESARIRAITILYAYRMNVMGVIEFIKAPPVAVAPPTGSPLGPTDMAAPEVVTQ